ncbi:MAG: carboxypeptidase-like regulatory domain-containing protein [Balneola sp.]
MKKTLSFFLLLIFLSASAHAQITIRGIVADAKTGERLPAAHVVIEGTYTGTIANEDGEFSLVVKSFPSTIVVRYIGFETQKKVINKGHNEPLDFLLKESVAEMEQLVVTSEDPAIAIMKEVIARKKIWRAKLDTYTAEAYSRQQLLNDTTIVSVSESVSEVFWDRKRGPREVLKSRRQTANIEGADNFAGVSYLPNFYDDELDIAGFDVVGITDERALKYYTFELVEYTSIDDKVVYEISVKAKRKLQPLFEGTIFVLDEEFALLSVKLKPNNVIVFPPPVQDFNLYYEQQFSNFGGDFWLPVDVRIDGLVEVGVVGLRFPPIGFHQVSKMNNYKVNIPLPDSLYKDNSLFSIDSTSVDKVDSIFTATVEPVPLSAKEELAYESLDSTATLEKAFRPKGFFTRFLDLDDEDDDGDSGYSVSSSGGGSSSGGASNSSKNYKQSKLREFMYDISPIGRFNRVDVLNLGLKHERRYLNRRLESEVKLSYSLGYEELGYGVGLSWWPLKKSRRFVVSAKYDADTETSYNSDLYGMTITSVMPLFGFDDYFNYYRNERFQLGTGYLPPKSRYTYRMYYNLEEHNSINYKTSYDVLGRDNLQRLNPQIEDGTLSSIKFQISRGDLKNNFGAIELNGTSLSVEQSSKFIGSDWNFTQFKLNVFKRFNTLYKKRFFPNTLDIRINAGTYLGDLPVQKNGALDASFGYITPFGAFRSKRYIPYQGASYFAVNAEHNFRSVPLEILGWRNAPQTGLSIIAFGGIGKTWNSNSTMNQFGVTGTDDLHLEVGGSVSNIFSLFRFDLAFRLDDPGLYPGISIARFF